MRFRSGKSLRSDNYITCTQAIKTRFDRSGHLKSKPKTWGYFIQTFEVVY